MQRLRARNEGARAIRVCLYTVSARVRVCPCLRSGTACVGVCRRVNVVCVLCVCGGDVRARVRKEGSAKAPKVPALPDPLSHLLSLPLLAALPARRVCVTKLFRGALGITRANSLLPPVFFPCPPCCCLPADGDKSPKLTSLRSAVCVLVSCARGALPPPCLLGMRPNLCVPALKVSQALPHVHRLHRLRRIE